MATASSIAAAQTDTERAGARAAAEQGAQAFSEGRFSDAIDLFRRAESLVHAPPHLLYMARSYVKLGHLVEGREEYLKIGRETLPESAPAAFRTTQEDASKELAALEPRVPYMTVTLEDPNAQGVTVMLDGVAMPAALIGVEGPVNPGKHRLVAVVQGTEGPDQKIDVAEGAHAKVQLALPAADVGAAAPVAAAGQSEQPPSDQSFTPTEKSSANGMRIGSYVAFGVGAIGLGAGTVFLIKGSSKQSDSDDLFKKCNPNCTSSQKQEIKSLDKDASNAKTLSLVGYAAGVAGVAAGVTLFILSGHSSSESGSTQITPWIGWNSAGVAGRF